MKKIIDISKIKIAVLLIVLFIAIVGITSFAATSGSISGWYSNNYANATVTNTNSNSRYCEVFIQGGSTPNSLPTIKYSSGTISSGNSLSIGKNTSATYIRARGVVYSGGSPNAGVGWSGIKWLK